MAIAQSFGYVSRWSLHHLRGSGGFLVSSLLSVSVPVLRYKASSSSELADGRDDGLAERKLLNMLLDGPRPASS